MEPQASHPPGGSNGAYLTGLWRILYRLGLGQGAEALTWGAKFKKAQKTPVIWINILTDSKKIMQIQIILGEQHITILHKTGSISPAFPFAWGSDMTGVALLLFLRIRWLKNLRAWFLCYNFYLEPYLEHVAV